MEFHELKEIVEEQTVQATETSVLERDITNEVKKWMDEEEVVVLVGVRRGGKTSIMHDLIKQFPGIFVNFEDERFVDFNYQDFQKIEELLKQTGSKYLYLDEVQNVRLWEKFVSRIHRRYKVVVSGSNSALLRSDYSTALTGRTITFRVHPLSYNEFLRFKGLKRGRTSFLRYLELGGFPRVVMKEDRTLLNEYFSTIIYKDVLPRYGFRYSDRVEKLGLFLASNVGKPISYRKLGAYLDIKHEETVKEYVKAFEDNFLVSVVHKWDPSLKKLHSYEKKVYMTDHGLSYIGKRASADSGRILENLVFSNLNHRYEDIFFYKNGGEVDFLVCEGLEPRFGLNVAFEVNKDNVKREQRALAKLKERFRHKVDVLLTSVYLKVDVEQPFSFVYDFLKNCSIN